MANLNPKNLKSIYRKPFGRKILAELFLNEEDNKYYILMTVEVQPGVMAVVNTNQSFDIWEKETAISEIDEKYNLWLRNGGNQLEEEIDNYNGYDAPNYDYDADPMSLSNLKANLKQLALIAKENMRSN